MRARALVVVSFRKITTGDTGNYRGLPVNLCAPCGEKTLQGPSLMDRISALNDILTENPKDAFARYGLAMEYSKQGDFDRALAEFSILIENHPDYTAGYFMAAQTLVRAERPDEAKKMLQDGIASARRTGNLHAQSEMEAMLGELS